MSEETGDAEEAEEHLNWSSFRASILTPPYLEALDIPNGVEMRFQAFKKAYMRALQHMQVYILQGLFICV